MKSLQAIAAPAGGGAENFFVRLNLAFSASDWMRTAVITSKHPSRDAVFADHDIPVYHAPFMAPSIDVLSPWFYRYAIAQSQPDVVMTWMNRATVLCPHPKKRRFVHVARLGDYYNLKYYTQCDYLVGNTPAVVDYLLKNGWPSAKVRYIPNFVDTPDVTPYNFGITDEPVIVAVGRLHPTKGYDVLLKALAQVPHGRLMLAGDGPIRQELEALAEEVGVAHRVTFMGWREDIRALMLGADVFVIPSRHEPLGNVVLEAWAAKVPVVAMASDGPKHLIVSGENGLLTPMEDVDSMAHALQELLDSPKLGHRLVQGAWATYQKLYSPATVVAQYQDFYTSIVKT